MKTYTVYYNDPSFKSRRVEADEIRTDYGPPVILHFVAVSGAADDESELRAMIPINAVRAVVLES